MGFQVNGFGTAPFSRTKERFAFVCPNEYCKSHNRGDGQAELQVRSARNWATALYVPLIPLGDQGIHGRCGTCKTNFTPDLFPLIAPEHFATP